MSHKTITEGDTKDWVYKLEDPETGEPMDLTDATVKMYMWELPSQSIVINGSACTHDDTGGTITYNVQAADVDEPGKFQRQWEVTLSGGDIKSYPDLDVEDRNILTIEDKVEGTDT